MHAITVPASTLCTGGLIFWASYFYFVLVIKPHLVQAGTSMRVANHTRAWTHTCKNGGSCYFKHLCPVVISNLNHLLEYWHNYPMLKLSSMSCSSALILAHIIKNNFNSAYCSYLHVVPQIDSYCMCAGDVRSK